MQVFVCFCLCSLCFSVLEVFIMRFSSLEIVSSAISRLLKNPSKAFLITITGFFDIQYFFLVTAYDFHLSYYIAHLLLHAVSFSLELMKPIN